MRSASIVLALVLFAASASAEELGRLFFTPAERQALDARRKAGLPDKPAAKPVTGAARARLDGFVRRSGGPTTVWVNGTALDESPRLGEGRSGGVTRIPVPVGNSGDRVSLKPGEALDLGTGEVTDVIGPDGRIRVHQRHSR